MDAEEKIMNDRPRQARRPDDQQSMAEYRQWY